MSKNKLLLPIVLAIFSGLQSAMALDLPPQVSDYLKTQHLMDEGDEPLPFCNQAQTGLGDVFGQYTLANWSAMLDDLATIAPQPRQQKLIIRVIEFLPGRTYLKAFNKLCDLEQKGVVSTKILEFAVHGRYPKNGFLSNNYQDPQVVQLAQRLQSLIPKDSKEQGLLTDILSGKQKGVDQDGAGEEGTPPPATLPPQ